MYTAEMAGMQGPTGRGFQLRDGSGSGIGKNISGRIGYGLGTGIGIKYCVNRVLSGIENLDRVFVDFLPDFLNFRFKNQYIVNQTCIWWTDSILHCNALTPTRALYTLLV